MSAAYDTLGRTGTAVCQKEIDALITNHPGINGVLVSTIDGFDVASTIRGTQSPAKLAAMTSSLLALGEAISSESAVGDCRDIVIDASQGRVLLMDVPHATRKLLLTVIGDNVETLGQVLWAARECRQEFSRRLGGVQ